MLLEPRPKPLKSPHPLEPTNPRCALCEAIRRLWSYSLKLGCLDTLRLRLGGSAMSSRLRQIAPSTFNHKTPAAQTTHTHLLDGPTYHRELYQQYRNGNMLSETARGLPAIRTRRQAEDITPSSLPPCGRDFNEYERDKNASHRRPPHTKVGCHSDDTAMPVWRPPYATPRS